MGGNENQRTIQAYDHAPDQYAQRTPAMVEGFVKEWIDQALSLLSPGATILELGTGTGRDASYLESWGFAVDRTEASIGLLERLRAQEIPARPLNVVTDEVGGSYDMVFANAVFHHFPLSVVGAVLRKVRQALKDEGIFAFSTKEGQGEQWETDKLGRPRFFHYWTAEALTERLTSTGFSVLQLRSALRGASGELWINVIARRNNG